jgi:multiple sugar transport system permease protein
MTTTSIDAPVGAQTTSRGNGRRPRQPGSGRHIPAHLFLGVLVVYFFIPMWWLFVASTKDAAGLFNGSNGALWFDETFALLPNLRNLFTYNEGIYLRWVANSLFYAIAGGVGATVLCVLAGYGFAKFRFRGRRLMLAVLLGSVMVPLTALVIPTFILFSNLHLTDTVWAVILPSMLNPFGVYLMQVYTAEAVPDELLEAARVDGAGEIKTFFRVALPLLRPGVITVLLLSIVGVWNNFFLPLAMLANTKLFPITVGLGLWEGQASGNNSGGANLWGIIIIGALVSVIPLIIAFLALQKYWKGGLSLGALK